MMHVKYLAEKIRTANDHGFSLMEMMVAMAITSIVFAGIYTAYRSQVGSYVGQEDVVEMQQNIRNAMYYMQRSVRMSGFDPQRTGLMGFVTNFPAPFDTLGATSDSNTIAFTSDDSANGDLTDDPDSELIAYRLNANQLQKLAFIAGPLPGTWLPSWETVAENIDALDFVYLDGDDPPNVLAPPLDATELADIRSIQITIVARAGQNPSPLAGNITDNTIYTNQQGTEIFNPAGDNFRRIILTAQANCRNLSL
jgi:type IV pilus assembly protein PilW